MRGRGRDNKSQGGRTPAGGRLNAGRGGTRPPPRTGTVPAIGAFLDLGKEINHGSVSNWMRKFKEYTRANYKSDVSAIFGLEGIPGEYPEYEAPEDIEEDANFMQTTRWKRAYELYDKKIIELDNESKLVFGLMLGQISEASKATIRETVPGFHAMLMEDPLLLLRAIILTHLSDPKLGTEQNLLRVRMAYETVEMASTDVLKYYYQRFKALRIGLEDTMRAAEVLPDLTPELTVQHERLAAIKFLNGLNAGYKFYVEYYEHNIKPWPDTLDEAYLEMSKVTPRRVVQQNPHGKSNILATTTAAADSASGKHAALKKAGTLPGSCRIPNGGRGREQAGRSTRYESTSYGTRPGSCNHCHEPGHYAYECESNPESNAATKTNTGSLKSAN